MCRPAHTNQERFNAIVEQWLTRLSHRELKVLLKALKHADDRTGDAWPSVEGFMETCGMDRRGVEKTLKQLAMLGVLPIIEAGGGRTRTTRRRVTLETPASMTGVIGRETPASNDKTPASNDTKTPVKDTGQTNHKNKPPEQTKAQPIPSALDTPEFRRAFEDFRTHRRESKKKLTPTAERSQLKRLEKIGVDRAIAAIEHSIAQGWQGIFESNERGNRPEVKNASRQYDERLSLVR